MLSSCVLGGGAGWSLYYLVKHLDRTRFDPIVVLPDHGIFRERYEALGVRVVAPTRLPHRTAAMRFAAINRVTAAASYGLNVWDSARFVPELASVIRRERVDLVYCNNMMVKAIGALAARQTGTPCVFHVRNVHERAGRVLLYAGTLARFHQVKRIIAVSEASAAPYRRFAPGKVCVIRNGVDLSGFDPDTVPRGTFRRELGVSPTAVLVGYTGQFIPRKGLDVLIRAAARVLPGRPDLEFVAVGWSPAGSTVDHQAGYEKLARDLGVGSRIRFVGFRDDVRPAVVDFDMLVLPAWQDPFPRAVIEALALGVPVVASRVGGIPEIVEHDRHGLLVPPGDVDALASAIAALADDPGRRRAIGRAARARALDRCDVARLTLDIQDVLGAAAAAR
jgi:glycosyltransferase involved in cell wall biosynthesis